MEVDDLEMLFSSVDDQNEALSLYRDFEMALSTVIDSVENPTMH